MAETEMQLVDWLDDLSVRFLLNLPPTDLSSVPRLCFQVEEAQWFYEDFIRPAAAAAGTPLPGLHLRQFCLLLFQHCPLLSGFTDAQHIAAYEEFLAYKVRVPVRGAILLDEAMERCLLVKGFKKGASWSFPRGKINKDERDLDCAIREVYEETGFDIRAAGLVPAEQEEEAKYIDITMREQHMRMFVFRRVPLDTYFEPRTRKEISKISWYNLKDLPGFKKRNDHGHGGEDGTNANKFYMVAPFLGPLKKWIAQQRKADAARAQQDQGQLGAALSIQQQGVTEHEADAEEEQVSDPGSGGDEVRTDELRRPLSIGGSSLTPNAPAIVQQEQNGGSQAQKLLAMLQGRGNSTVPQTPLEQIQGFPQIPHTPQPHHPRQHSIGYAQPPPQFPFSPPNTQQQPQQQQRNFSVPAPPQSVFCPHQPQRLPQQHMQAAFSGVSALPTHMQQQAYQYQQQQRQQSLPNMPSAQQQGPVAAQNGSMPFDDRSQQQLPAQPPTGWPNQQQASPNAFAAQGAQGAIASGPSVPNASQLPPPKMNAHSLNLLNAFKSEGGNKPSQIVGATPSNNAMRARTTQQQAALLDLFRKPSSAQAPTLDVQQEAKAAEEAPLSPILTDIAEKSTKPRERKASTINMITRTLPLNIKRKESPGLSAPTPVTRRSQAEAIEQRGASSQAQQLPEPVQPRDALSAWQVAAQTLPTQYAMNSRVAETKKPEEPPPRQSGDTFKETFKQTSADQGRLGGPRKVERTEYTLREGEAPNLATQAAVQTSQQPKASPVMISQRPDSGHVPHSPKAAPAVSPAISPARAELRKNKGAGNGTRSAPFTILTRPGSRQAGKSPLPQAIATATAASETPKPAIQPKVLQRPKAAETGSPTVQPVDASQRQSQQSDKKDQLLALFDKVPAPSSPPLPPPLPDRKPSQQETLLNLLTTVPSSGAASQQLVTPPAPQLVPERKPSHQAVPSLARQGGQNALLDLFKRPGANSALTSPESPISPFTLGTPVARQAPPTPLSRTPTTQTAQVQPWVASPQEEPRSGLNSAASVGSNGTAKGFLLGYLEGVVAKEGFKRVRK